MTATPLFSQQQEAFLREHRIAALATGRRDGSPQLSHVVYEWDGSRVLISVKSYTAKWNNALRQPRVALLVHEGRTQLVIYGRAEGISEDPERSESTARVFAKMTGNPDFAVSDDFIAGLDAQRRTVLAVTPETVHFQE